MILLIAIVIIGFILAYVYIETDRQEIQKKQEALQKDEERLKAKLAEQERLRHEEFMNKPYEGGV
jgi:mannose/fructose/N-acetylgalactosamine-specific phosphotransferase system component IIC